MLHCIYEVEVDLLVTSEFSWVGIGALVNESIVFLQLVPLLLFRLLPCVVTIGSVNFEGLLMVTGYLMSIHVDRGILV